MAIASLAGDEWKSKAIQAIMALSDKDSDPKTYGVTLLTDIKEIFANRIVEKIFSSDLIEELCKDKEKPWSTFRHGSPIDQRTLANLLKEFAILSKNIRIGHQVQKGYDLEQFTDSFARYLPISADFSATPLQPAESDDYDHISIPLQNIVDNLSATPRAAVGEDCSV